MNIALIVNNESKVKVLMFFYVKVGLSQPPHIEKVLTSVQGSSPSEPHEVLLNFTSPKNEKKTDPSFMFQPHSQYCDWGRSWKIHDQ